MLELCRLHYPSHRFPFSGLAVRTSRTMPVLRRGANVLYYKLFTEHNLIRLVIAGGRIRFHAVVRKIIVNRWSINRQTPVIINVKK